ncbi:MAG: tetratricopeptide repeat protein [Gemmatimonadaceae bacterium]
MNGNQLSAMAALRAVEPIAARLDRTREGEDRAADILELWQGTETSLRALMGGSSLTGQGLIRELRQKEMISLGQAYALLEFLGARDRANRTSYKATDNDIVVAREGFRQLEAGLAASVNEPTAPPIAPAPVTAQPVAPPTPDYSRPTAAAADAAPVAGSGMRSAPPPPASYGPPPSAPVTPDSTYTDKPSRMPANLWFLVALIVLVVAAIGGYFVFAKRSTPETAMNAAIADMQSGKHEAAKGEFSTIARDNPNLATPHVFLSRLAREEGDLGTARRELENAIRLEPGNAIALREMGLILFSAGNYELARRFFIRALEANPADNASQGYLGCALSRLNRLDEAQRFLSRAGPGSWSSCLPNRPL